MAMRCVLLIALLAGVAAIDQSPIQKVVKLVTEMKDQTAKEGEMDLEAYNKYKCWCETTTSEKSAAIEAAETKIEELTSFIEEATAKEAELKTEIGGLEEDIASDTQALQTATAQREEQNAAFTGEEADMKETLGLLTEAVATLSKVQLVQKPQAHQEALVQVSKLVHRVSPKFQGQMQKDLFDMLGEFKNIDQASEGNFRKTVATGSFLGEVFMPKREAAAFAQAVQTPPGAGGGAAAGSKSYNSRSGAIFGILDAQKDEFNKKLASATKEEEEANAAFNRLSAAKNGEIAAATQQKDAKENQLADTMDKASKAKEDLEATTNALTADQNFLAEATKTCATEDELYAKRSTTRNAEIEALAETLDILTGDEARSLFDKTMNFLQVGAVSRADMTRAAMQAKAQSRAMQTLLMVSKSHKSWQLAGLAVRVKLDAFTKVKKAMDTMLAELKSQQKAEYAKWETCKKDIDTTEDKIWDGKVVKRDLAEKAKDIANTLATDA